MYSYIALLYPGINVSVHFFVFQHLMIMGYMPRMVTRQFKAHKTENKLDTQALKAGGHPPRILRKDRKDHSGKKNQEK